MMLVLVLLLLVVLGTLQNGANVARGGEASFVGAERCRLCHRDIYLSWQKTAHRGATDRLTEAERAAGCVGCHSTGPQALRGVQCESCHGAGGNYWPAEIMIDPVKSREAGLIEPGETVCRTCHGGGPPGHRNDFAMPSPAERLRAVH
jgi:hypothetical protein